MSAENPEQKSEKEPVKEIKDASSFEELLIILEGKGGIQGSKQFFPLNELRMRIETVRGFKSGYAMKAATLNPLEYLHTLNTKDKLGLITRTEGLRDKVSELIYQELEQMNKDYREKKFDNPGT